MRYIYETFCLLKFTKQEIKEDRNSNDDFEEGKNSIWINNPRVVSRGIREMHQTLN